MNAPLPHIAVAPMMDCTDRHDRYFLRLIAPDVLLYTEMITTSALLHGDVHHLLQFHPAEKYLALQLGGCDPQALAYCARLGEDYGYDEINLNVGCPSPRVSSAKFGACLMLEPQLVADGISQMKQAVEIPVTVKCRIGVDEQDNYAYLQQFIKCIADAGCSTFIIHARKAWLKGLSPKQNREIPPLNYAVVHQIKKDFPHLKILINGGLKTVAQIKEQLMHVDGAMIGREAYANPYLLADIQREFFNTSLNPSRAQIMADLIPYVETQLARGVRLSAITRHILGLYHTQVGARRWRRFLSENACQNQANVEVLHQAMALIEGGNYG